MVLIILIIKNCQYQWIKVVLLQIGLQPKWEFVQYNNPITILTFWHNPRTGQQNYPVILKLTNADFYFINKKKTNLLGFNFLSFY